MIKITIIEDEITIQQMYCMKFKLEDYQVSVAANGEDGLKVIQAELPDIILLDLKMPVMGGEEMLRKLRSTDWGKDIPVIILTNISRAEAPRTLWHLGVSEYIVKANTTPQRIVERVQHILAQLA